MLGLPDAAVEFWQACFVIRDLAISDPEYDSRRFRAAFFSSPLVEQLERVLVGANSVARGHAIFTLGKTCSVRSIPALASALSVVKSSDPLAIPRLFLELWWLEQEPSYWRVEELTADEWFVVRWAALE